MSPEPRRSSFAMMRLRRTKSQDLNKAGGRKASKEQHRPRQDSISKTPPKLPEFVHPANEKLSNSFGGDLHPDTSSVISSATTAADLYSGRPSIDPGRSFVSAFPIPPVPAWDSYARTESMTNRGRYSYASSAVSTINSPRRVRRRKDPTPFNILIVGTRGAGKTSFLEFLKGALAPPPKKRLRKNESADEDVPSNGAVPNGNFIPHYVETEIDGERIGLTLWDSEGLEKNVVDLQLREMSAFLESKFEETFTEEMKVVRSPGVQDTHIHAVFLVLDPARLDRNLATARKVSPLALDGTNGGLAALSPRVMGALDEDLDLQVLRALQAKTTVIPVISKADTVTVKHMNVLKKSVWESLKKAGLDPLEALGLNEDEDSAIDTSRIEEVDEDAQSVRSDSRDRPPLLAGRDDNDDDGDGYDNRDSNRDDRGNGMLHDENGVSPASSSPHSKRMSGGSIRRHKVVEEAKEEDEVPFLPLSVISPDLYEPGVVGRQFPWGFADPYDEGHCDFVKLKEAVFSEWRAELREASREQWYEGWRTSRLKYRDGKGRRR